MSESRTRKVIGLMQRFQGDQRGTLTLEWGTLSDMAVIRLGDHSEIKLTAEQIEELEAKQIGDMIEQGTKVDYTSWSTEDLLKEISNGSEETSSSKETA